MTYLGKGILEIERNLGPRVEGQERYVILVTSPRTSVSGRVVSIDATRGFELADVVRNSPNVPAVREAVALVGPERITGAYADIRR